MRVGSSQMKADAICIFIGPAISRGSPICSALFFKLIFKNNKFLYLYYRMLRHYYKNFGNESYFKFSYGNFNYRAESPNATPNQDWWSQPSSVPVCAPHYNMQIRDMCSVYICTFSSLELLFARSGDEIKTGAGVKVNLVCWLLSVWIKPRCSFAKDCVANPDHNR
jgi:hypothetical protein